MNRRYLSAGKSTRKRANRHRRSAKIIAIMGILATIGIGLILQNAKQLRIYGIAPLVLLGLIYILPNIIDKFLVKELKKEKRAIRGSVGEEEIGKILEDLPEDFYVLNDVESPFGNIDHIVIAKYHGIFLIETKAHGGRVDTMDNDLLINGKPPEKDFINQVLQNTYWLRDEICEFTGTKPWITPVLVFTNAFVPPSKPIKGIRIINKRYLSNILKQTGRSTPVNDKIWDIRESIYRKLLKVRD